MYTYILTTPRRRSQPYLEYSPNCQKMPLLLDKKRFSRSYIQRLWPASLQFITTNGYWNGTIISNKKRCRP